jgi:glycerol-3-phosphate dehydrogenase
MSRWRRFAKIAGVAGAVTIGGGTFILTQKMFVDRHAIRTEAHVEKQSFNINQRNKLLPLPTRSDQIKSLNEEEFDVLVIGGGATGSGCVLDAATRGLKTAMVEADDFSSGTSSRSTKLIHGGLRYLQKAIMKLDYEQYKMVEEALHERGNLLDIAPHLSFPLPIMLPVYKVWQIPYFWLGIKAYDFVSGSQCLKSSFLLSKERALELFPMLKRDKLKGGIVYYDGSHNDARMCISLAITAARHGATIANHVKVTGLVKAEDGKITGAKMRDELSGKEWITKAKSVINATGPFTDAIRKMDNQEAKDIVCPAAGVHIVLPDYYSPEKMGLIDPETSDGRVIFLLPWLNHTIAGTTDSPCKVTFDPSPSEEDIMFILNEVKNYLSPDVTVRRGDVLSAWSGIRPLVKDPNKEDTQSLVRNHVIHVSPSGLVTIAGGKWTTYRSMALETVDAAVKESNLKQKMPSQTDGLLLEGAHQWTPTMYIKLVQDIGVDSQVAQHLSETYGDRAFSVGRMASRTGQRWPVLGQRLHPEFPYIEAEVRYAIKEYAATAVDVIARRLRLSFLNVQAAEEALPRIIEIMGEELKWSSKEKAKQMADAMTFLNTQMGKDANRAAKDNIPITLTKTEVSDYVKRFNLIDADKKGYVSLTDIRRLLRKHDEDVDGNELHQILSEIDTNKNGQVELDEYLQGCFHFSSCRPSNLE